MVASRDEILDKFKLFQGGTGGLDSWLGDGTPDVVFEALADLENRPLTRATLNQLLTLAHEAPISDALFRYYWLSAPKQHPYDVSKIPCFDDHFCGEDLDSVTSLDHLYWGFYRFYVDALLFFGNVRTAFQQLRHLPKPNLHDFFSRHRFDSADLRLRGETIGPVEIEKGNRYLISEMACKSLEAENFADSELAQTLLDLYHQHQNQQAGQVTADQLLDGAEKGGKLGESQQRLYLSADDFLDDPITDENDLLNKIERVHGTWKNARNVALKNTEIYLSMVGDLDVYVATSMRERDNFNEMANFCDRVFTNQDLLDLHMRYFDPTLSAAKHHEDKGLIECLMVERAKVLVLQAGSGDSYGKDAEAAMALSLGKPVIIHADTERRRRLFTDIHPLSRLINFETGVAIGAMVADSPKQVIELLRRIFNNDLEYKLEQLHPKYLVLKEKTTCSVVRLQTSDDLIRETFWNHYHNDIR